MVSFLKTAAGGRFLVATGAAEKGGEDRPPGNMVYSACLNPTGPRCTLHFSTWLAESRQGNEGLEVYVLPFCHYCGERGQMRETRGLPFGLHGHSPANHTGSIREEPPVEPAPEKSVGCVYTARRMITSLRSSKEN
ncbi:hypothetical protein ACOMHN_051035 [Nucella lapillus]